MGLDKLAKQNTQMKNGRMQIKNEKTQNKKHNTSWPVEARETEHNFFFGFRASFSCYRGSPLSQRNLQHHFNILGD